MKEFLKNIAPIAQIAVMIMFVITVFFTIPTSKKGARMEGLSVGLRYASIKLVSSDAVADAFLDSTLTDWGVNLDD